MLTFKNFFLFKEAISLQNARDLSLNKKSSGAYNIPVLNNIFGKKDRLVYDLDIDKTKIIKVNKVFITAKDVLSKLGYSLDTAEDYIKGIAYAINDRDKKQPNKIGRILQKNIENLLQKNIENSEKNIENSEKNIENSDKLRVYIEFLEKLADSFKKDPVRTAKNKNSFKVVISRHPYDIAGISTDRAWRSCLALGLERIEYTNNDFSDDEGVHAEFVYQDIKAGTIVAYLIAGDDVHANGKVAIRRPLSRILMKPYTSNEDPNNVAYSIGKIYGANSKPFINFIKNWLTKTVNTNTTDKAYIRNDYLYNDQDKPVNFEISTLPAEFIKPYKKIINGLSAKVRNNVEVKYIPTHFSATEFGPLEFKISFQIPKNIINLPVFSNHIPANERRTRPIAEITKQLRADINEVIKSTLGLSSKYLKDVNGWPDMAGFEFRNYIICSYIIMNVRRVYKDDPEAVFKDLGLEKLNWEATMAKLQEVLKSYAKKYNAIASQND